MPEKYDINGNPIGFFSVEDEGMRYVDPTVIQPAVVSANRRYWEAQKWARENVRDPRERTAPYVAAGLGVTMAAPFLIEGAVAGGLAAANSPTMPLWKAAARRMAIDLPAFEAVDRLPQAWGDERFTTQGTNLIKQTTPIGQFAPWAVDISGPFIAGMVPGMAGDMVVRGTAAGVNGVLNGIGRRVANNRMGYLAPMADVLSAENIQSFELPEINAAPIVEQKAVQTVAPYTIEDLGGGYMLKSLMRGNPLEKQVGKNGTVSVNNVRALVGKGSKVEQAVVDKVLSSDAFAGKKAIDYNKFRKAVQDELITYERTPNTRFKDYGLNRIGYPPSQFSTNIRGGEMFNEWANRNYENIGYLSDDILPSYRDKNTGEIISWNDLQKKYRSFVPGSETYTFSSPRIPSGSAKHYGPNTLGHSRTYTTADEPDVLHVMESQSDWAQGGGYEIPLSDIDKYQLKQTEEILANNADRYGELNEPRRKMHEATAKYLREKIEKDWSSSEAAQGRYLSDNFTSRQIQENLRYAAEKGQKKMRYPTKETAAKIEGYSKETKYYDADGNPVTDIRKIYTIGKENEKELDLIQRELDGYYAKFNVAQLPNGDYVPAGKYSDNPYQQLIDAIPRKQAAYDGWRASHPNATSEKGQRIVDDMKRRAEEIKNFRMRVKYLNQRMKELKSIKPYVDPSIKEEEKYMHEDDILRKYNEFPKQFKKLYKNADVRTVTDPKGNTWYEVDVPENYLQQEWPYKNGGLLDRLNKHYNGDRSKIIQAMQYARGGFKRNDVSDKDGSQYYDIVRQRRNSVFNALMRSGMSADDAARLTPMIVTQQTMEGGWVLNRKDNNFGGMKINGTQTISYDSEDDFQDAYIKMLDSKWHTGRDAKYSWRSARDLDDWARILNREDLGLHTEADWKKYNKGRQGNDFVYLYAPEWANDNKTYRQHLRKTEDRTAAYLKMVEADEPLMSLSPRQEERVVRQMPIVPEQPAMPLGMFRTMIPTSVQQKMPATQDAQQQAPTQAPLLRSLIPTSVQKILNSKDAGGLLLKDYASGGSIHIAPSKKGTFTAAAKKHGKSVQAFASQVLANKENYSPAMVKKANFARNAAKWHGDGGLIERYGIDKVRAAMQKVKR